MFGFFATAAERRGSARALPIGDRPACGRAGNHGNSRVRSGPVRAQVRVAWVVGRRHRAEAARERVQVIGIESRRRDERMVPVADEHEVAIGDLSMSDPSGRRRYRAAGCRRRRDR